MKKLINRALAAKKTNFFFMALLCAGSVLANEATPQTAIQETTIQEMEYPESDTIFLEEDTILVPFIPAPQDLDMRPIRKATQAAACPTDSIVGFGTDGEYVSKTEYEYDAAGNTIVEIKYQWNNGVKTGVSRFWKKFTGSTATTTVNYTWVNGEWVEKDSTQLTYSGSKNTGKDVFVWENNAWRPSKKYEYEYTTSGKQTLSQYSEWNASAQALLYKNKREYAYDVNENMILNAYWLYSNNAWVGSTKSVWEYDSKKNKLLEEVYSGWENGNWKGKAKGKTTYKYNDAKKVTEKIVYTWSAGAWVESQKTETDYEGSNVKDNAIYNWNGEWVGASRTSTVWLDSQRKSSELVHAWNSAEKKWDNSKKTEYEYSGSTTTLTMQASYNWIEGKWVGITKFQKTFNAFGETSSIDFVWGTDDWVGSAKVETEYTASGKVDTKTTYIWSGSDWAGVTKEKTEYAANGLIDTQITYTWDEGVWVGTSKIKNTYDEANRTTSVLQQIWAGTDWENSTRTLYEYSAKGVNSLTVNDQWDGADWQAVDSTKHEVIDITIAGKEYTTLDIQSNWNSTNNKWIGTSKSEWQYDEAANVIQYDTYSFANDNWENKTRMQYAYKNNNPSLQTLSMSMKFENGKWNGNFKYEYDYDDTERKIETAQYSWNSELEKWKGESKTKNVYSGSQIEVSYVYKWIAESDSWVYSIRYQYQYDSKEREILRIISKYNQTKEDWVYQTKYAYEFDAKHSDPIVSSEYEWNTEIEDWCDKSMTEKSYDQNTAGRLRYELDETYADCDLTVSDMKRYYYHCDTYWKILFVDWDGKEIANLQVLDSETPKNPGKQTREADKQYTYEFTGWGEKIVAATENKTYTAHYEATPRKYTVTFYDEDGVTVRDSQKDVEYGATPVYGGPELSKESTAQYTYAFSQWGDNGVKAVEGDTSYIAHYAATLRQYTVIFANYDNKPLQSSLVDYGTKPAYTGETPAKASDVQYTYTFTGWDPEIADVTGAATYTAKFSETTNQYTVKFYADEAKENLLYSNAFDFGTMPEYSGETPAKAGDAQYSYAFVGWGDNGMKTVTGDTAYIAKFSQSVNQYTVAFYADEAKENLLYSNQFSYGATPEYQGETPAKAGDAQYSYTFSGWIDGIVAVTGDTAYIAKFSQSVNQYTVKFYADEAKENLLYSNEFAYGAMPEYQGETPAKAGDAQYSYTFSGWSDGIVAVTGDTAYIAKFDATVNTYSITFEVKGNSALKHTIDNVPYGTLVNDLVAAVKTALGGDSFEDENYIYTFAGIEDLTETDIVTGDETFYVLYTATPKTTTGLENIQQAAPATKVFENGVMYILRDGKKYTMQGEVVD